MEIETPNVDLYTEADYAAVRRRLARIVGLGVAAFAALVYFLTLSPGVFPGESAELMAIHSGLEPMVAPSHTIWSAIVRRIAALGPSGMVVRLNFFSLVVGVAAVWLLFDILQRTIGSLIERETASPKTTAVAAVVGAAGGALALAFSVPFWMASTRLQYQGFNLLLLLGLFRLLVWFLDSDNNGVLILLAFLSGVVAVEALGTVCFLPFFAVVVMRRWVRRGGVSAAIPPTAALVFAVGLTSALVIALSFTKSHDISLRGYKDVWAVAQHIFLDQALSLKTLFVRRGWLNIAILVGIPWLAAAAIAREGLNETREWGIMIMHAAMSVAVAIVLGNAPVLSPWGLFRDTGVLPVPLLAMSAMTMGYLLAYWYLIIVNSTQVNIDGERTFAQRSSVWFGYFFGVMTLVVSVVTAGINVMEANGRNGRFVDECAREIISSLEGRKWIVSDGLFDSHILIEAHRTGKAIRLIELQNNDSKVYLRYLRNVINEDPDFRMKGVDIGKLENGAALGVIPFLQDWFECDPTAVDRLLVMSAPDLLVSAGKVVVPHFFCFKAGANLDSLKGAPFLEAHREFWARMQKPLAKSRGVRDAAAAYRTRVRRQVGFVANNAGVLLEDLGMDEEAFQTYSFVRQFDPENVSAILNLVELLHRRAEDGFHADARAEAEGNVERLVKELAGRRLPIWSLSRVFGYVRSPVLFTQLGWAWAASGQPGIAMSGLQRAEQVSATPAAKIRVRQAEAQLLWQQNDIDGSEAIYEDILKEDPTNSRAMISVARVQVRRGSLDKAREWLAKARDNGADKTALAFEGATLDLAAGRPADARVKLSEVTDVQPNNIAAWGMLGIAAIQMGDYDDVETRIIPRMVTIAGTTDDYLVLVLKGQLLYQRKDLAGARDSFERASMLRSGITALMEWILRLDFALDDKEAAEEHARQLMRTSRTNSFANYIMGSIMLYRGRNDEAEDFLRRSVNAGATPEALNDLAELLRIVGNLGEAKRRIDEAIAMAPDFYVLWDTLGGILAAKGDVDGAEEAYKKALSLFNEDYRVAMNYAKVLIRKNELQQARTLLMKANEHRSTLSAADQETLANLIQQASPKQRR